MKQETVWDEIAKEWSAFRDVPSPSIRAFLEDKTGKILDVGCGTGRNLINIPGLSWFGVDFSTQMLALATKKADRLGISFAPTKAVAWNMPFPDASFDVVLCNAVLHCIQKPKEREETVAEIFRVLKKGGVAYLSAWGPKSPRLKNKGKECYVPWTVKQKTKLERYTYIYALEELEKQTKKAGFTITRSWEERNVNLIVKKPFS